MNKIADTATGDKVEPKPRRSLVDRAYGAIKQRLMGNHYPPNLQILEQDLAGQLEMSRTPVREALIRLEREGLVEIIPRRGMRVVPLSPEDMREIYEIMICLEARAAERLAERHPTESEIAPMIEAHRDMVESLERGDLDSWAAADDRFHRNLIELAGNRRLTQIAFATADQIHRARMVTLRIRPLPRKSNDDHMAVIDAILAGDAKRAYETHANHLINARAMLTKILERYNLSQL